MKTLYLDLISGIAGDMFIAALLDLGVDPQRLERELKKLKLDGYHLHISRQQKSSIDGVKFDVHLTHDHDHDHTHEHEHVHESACGIHVHSHAHEHHHDHDHHHEPHHHDHSHEGQRNFSEIKQIISRSKLSAW